MNDMPYIKCIYRERLHWPDWIVQIAPDYIPVPVKTPSTNSGSAYASRAIRTNIKQNAHLWHQRLGHIHYDTLAHLVKHGLIEGVDITPEDIMAAKKDHVCEVCLMARYDQSPFGVNDRRATRPMEKLHSDLQQYEIPSLGGSRWALTLLDDFSDNCGVAMLKTKKQAKFELKRMIKEWETLSGYKAHTLYTDRGSEYLNQVMKKFCAKHGIIHEKSPTRVHQLHGRAENLNKRLGNRLRAMLYTYNNVPKEVKLKLWAEGLSYCALLHNVSLVRRLNMTPIQAFTGKVPDVKNLRTFGCKLYYRVSDEVRTKLQPKGEPAIYLGPSFDGPGVRILTYHPENKQMKYQVKVVRDVFILESLTQTPDVQRYEGDTSGGYAPQVFQAPLVEKGEQVSDRPALPVTPQLQLGEGGSHQEVIQYAPPSHETGVYPLIPQSSVRGSQHNSADIGLYGSRSQGDSMAHGNDNGVDNGPRDQGGSVSQHTSNGAGNGPRDQSDVNSLEVSLSDANGLRDQSVSLHRESRDNGVTNDPRDQSDPRTRGNIIPQRHDITGGHTIPAEYIVRTRNNASNEAAHTQVATTGTIISQRMEDADDSEEEGSDNEEVGDEELPELIDLERLQIGDVDNEVPGESGESLEPQQRYSKRQRKPPENFSSDPRYYVPRKGTWSELFANVGTANVAIHVDVGEDDDYPDVYEGMMANGVSSHDWLPEFCTSEVSKDSNSVGVNHNSKKKKHGKSYNRTSVPSLLDKVNSPQKPKPVTQWTKVDVVKDTPNTYTEALNSKYREEWSEALIDEYKSLMQNNTWHLVPRNEVPKDKQVIPSKWVFKIKTDQDNFPVRFKCRLVAGGHRQRYGEDYDLTYAPVSRVTTLRVLLSVAAARNWKVYQLDIKTAFLHGDIDTDVYMEQPEGFVDDPNMVCMLDKCLYGLKQAPRAWYIKLTEFLSDELGFVVSDMDSSLWIKSTESGKVYIAMVVDDLAITGTSSAIVQEVIQKILNKFPGTPPSIMKWYIGMKVTWLPAEKAVVLSQTAHIDSLLKKFEGKGNFMHPLDLPMKAGLKLYKTGSSDKPYSPLLDTTKYPYRSLVGALNYIACTTRPDIAYTVNKLSKYLHQPRVEHWDIAINLLRYLKATRNWGLKLGGGGKEEALCYCDASFGTEIDPESGNACEKSTTGSVFIVNCGAVHWKSSSQEFASRSTTDSEYRACCDATCDALWLMELLRDFDMECRPFLIRNDSQGALCAICNQNITQRTKHIARQVGFVRDYYKKAMVTFEHIAGSENVADVLTKPLGGTKHRKFTTAMGLCSMSAYDKSK
jgi:hypothetical protein